MVGSLSLKQGKRLGIRGLFDEDDLNKFSEKFEKIRRNSDKFEEIYA